MDGWGRVIAAAVDRRSQLGWTQKRLAKEAGVAERTVQNFEAGKRPQPVIRGKLERALGWEPGEMRRIAEAEEDPPDPIPADLRDHIRSLLPPDRAERVEAELRAGLRGEPPPSSELPSGRAAAG